jgi:hypothetical protein
MAKKKHRRRGRKKNPKLQDLLPVGIGLGMGALIMYFYVSSLPNKQLPA